MKPREELNGERQRGYRPIGDYGLIGDMRTAALVARDGAIDWYCPERFDAPAVFCRLLDAQKGGWLRVGPTGEHEAARVYLGDTNILVTTFATGTGRVRLTDLMPVPLRSDGSAILRLVEGLRGVVDVEVAFRPTFDYARADTVLTAQDGGAIARAGVASLALTSPVALRPHPSGALVGTARVAAGERLWVMLVSGRGGVEPTRLSASEADDALDETLASWRTWSARCTYTGPYHQLVRRSALLLNLLTYEPTGAVVAAPTTSLPEAIGGVRNWDYRYTWLRDSAYMLDALQSIGYHAAADRFFGWLERLCLVDRGDLQIMYAVDGGAHVPERTLDHLAGYRGSRPVRIGNGAASQTQLDVFGDVLGAAHLHLAAQPDAMSPSLAAALRALADHAAAGWREPDQGIWEVRGGPRHFLYSKLLCWVALDRAILLAPHAGLSGDVGRWRRERAAIRRAILHDGYDRELGAFTQVLGEPGLDASALAIPLVGFLSATDPRVRATVDRIVERLTANGLVYRYLTADGLPGGEATFVLCSFWLADALARAGRLDEARTLFERVVGHANDLGLLAEEIDPTTGELLGNFPQGFSHLALIQAGLSIARSEARDAEHRARTMAQRQGAAASARRADRSQKEARRDGTASWQAGGGRHGGIGA